MSRTPVLAFCGSLRAESLNLALLELAESLAPELHFVGSDLVRHLPLFNTELDADTPASVRQFRDVARAARAVVIASPEYVHTPSGVTMNSLEWLMGTGALEGKPVLLMSASPGQTGGIRGLVGLFPPLQLLGGVLLDPVSISRAASRIDSSGGVLDPVVYQRVEFAVDELRAAMVPA
ncbi:MAG: NADPH-dependent reductase [Rhodoglobus sp.]|jgi:NAD(P)H-dependent FMN reductase|nr:NADPH-dependent reductase [Rhodoglobus sp.]